MQRAALQATATIRGVQEAPTAAPTTGNDTVASAAAGLQQSGVSAAQPADASPSAPAANMAAMAPTTAAVLALA